MTQNDLTPEHFILAARHALASEDAAHVEHDAPRILASAHRMGLRLRVQLWGRPPIPCASDWWGGPGCVGARCPPHPPRVGRGHGGDPGSSVNSAHDSRERIATLPGSTSMQTRSRQIRPVDVIAPVAVGLTVLGYLTAGAACVVWTVRDPAAVLVLALWALIGWGFWSEARTRGF